MKTFAIKQVPYLAKRTGTKSAYVKVQVLSVLT
jgi:hypothetical protein